MTRRWRAPGLIAAVAAAALTSLPALAQAKADGDKDDNARVTLTGPIVVAPHETVDDVVSFDGPVTVDGDVEGDVVAFNGPVRINGKVTGDVVSFGDRTILGPRAEVNGDLVYADEKPVVPESAKVAGETQRISADQVNKPFAGVVTQIAVWLAFTISTLVVGVLLLWLAPGAADAAHRALRERTGPTIGWGILFFFVLPILAVIALVTLVGIPLGIALLAALFPLYALSYTTGAFLLGRLVVKPERGSRWVAFFAGWAILRVVALVPVLGGLAWLVATIVGLGALLVALWRARQAGPAAATPAAA